MTKSLILLVVAIGMMGGSISVAGQVRYRKHDIAVARFGEGERQQLLKQAYALKENIDRQIIGQERVTKALQDRIIQYVEGFGTRTREPIALHLIGLPGIGKSVMLDELQKLGFDVVRIDAQVYSKVDGGSDPTNDLYERMKPRLAAPKPVILLVDELDKLPELTQSGEITRPFIGVLNQILTDGHVLTRYSGELNLSNVMVISTMNFSPEEIETFSEQALKEQRKYYDYSTEDFAAFDEWITKDPSARYKVLSNLFRSNTVSRLAPNTVVMKPLSRDDYAKIVRINIDKSIARAQTGASAAKRLEIAYSEAFAEFLFTKTVYAPSGARETVYKVDALTDQLINFATKATANGQDSSLDIPRRIAIDYSPEQGRVIITVTPLILRGKELVERNAFQFEVAFDDNSRLFLQPENIALVPPKSSMEDRTAGEKEPRVYKKDVLGTRFPKNQRAAKGLADKINQTLLGQGQFTRLIEKELNGYLGRSEPVAKQPPFLVFAGFPGIGKSELVNLTATHLELPVARINMQAFSSDAPEAHINFMQTLSRSIDEAKQKAKGGKFILLFEELDKVFEISPSGNFVNRPVMAVIKDLLNDGIVQMPSTEKSFSNPGQIDIRGAYSMITMNFAVDRFGFEADPRLTSIDDVLDAWRMLSTRVADLKKLLGAMFLPETVSRLMPRFFVMKPLEEGDYRKIIEKQVEIVVRERLIDAKGINRGQIEVRLTPAYKRYLYSETVIPSEGARNTAVASRNRIATDLEAALSRIPKSSTYATAPLNLTLDFKPKSSVVVASVMSQGSPEGAKPKILFRHEVALTYPPLDLKGRIPEERLLTAIHEFGHAFTSIRLGRRIQYATVVPPKQGVGGYVKFKDGPQSAKAILSSIYSALASRAMERIFLSEDPVASGSVLDITAGASNDIKQATQRLWAMIYEIGMDPRGGTIERMGMDGMSRYAAFSDLPAELVEKLGLVLRDMENQVVADLLKAHDRAWYHDKVVRFAKAGGLNEAEFFALIGYPHPGENENFLGEESAIRREFSDVVREVPAGVKAAGEFRQGKTKTTARQNMASFADGFAKIVEKRLHMDVQQISVGFKTNICETLLTAK